MIEATRNTQEAYLQASQKRTNFANPELAKRIENTGKLDKEESLNLANKITGAALSLGYLSDDGNSSTGNKFTSEEILSAMEAAGYDISGNKNAWLQETAAQAIDLDPSAYMTAQQQL